ncbi:class A beta-lactamase-related serine hydrolase [Bacillus salacetis]|uniref:Class A beta-lactamase-related serine hydrolase n=1 Tax=Bacillus salacetis TaxID=2315464 RepID=A0A3A1RBH5_9BACI|nr:serine hydrolase domain-containing protein [Bacillus salacetis]RIW39006.1 class A beta-lactamase-related serine hydrolase [Bacillus salacetis]
MHMYERLVSWVEEIKDRNQSPGTALFIIKDNRTVLEHYSGRLSNSSGASSVTGRTRFNIASARKSYLGLAAAYAVFERKIGSLDDAAAEYFPEYSRDLLGSTTIRHLITHSHGLHLDEAGRPFREFPPGENWAYRGINVLMMTDLIQRLYGKSFPQLLKERVFDPLGFQETGWETTPSEHLAKVVVDPGEKAISSLGATTDGMESNLFVSARELALWGNLHLQMGKVDGKQIVPREVIELATSNQSPSYKKRELPQNGFFWYVQGDPAAQSELGELVPKGSYQILGVTGPAILMIPEYQAVVVKMYNKRYNYGGENYLHYLREFSNLAADCLRKEEVR